MLIVKRIQIVIALLVSAAVFGTLIGSSFARPRTAARVADAMPADKPETWKAILDPKDFEGILKLQTVEIEKSTKSSGLFMRGFRKVEWLGHVVALLGNAGTMTLTGEDAKKAAALRDGGLALAAAGKAKKFNDAKQAAAVVLSYPDSIVPASDAAPKKWTEVMPLAILMKCVSNIDNDQIAANKSKTKADFGKVSRERGLQSVLLSCLAVVAREHKEEGAAKIGKTGADAADWVKWCDEMRADAFELSKEYFRKDQPGATKAYEKLQKSCNDCHEVYRKDE